MLDETTGTSGTQVNNGDDLMHFDLKDILDPAHYVDRFLFICTTILTVVGILINMLVIGAIVFFKRLHFPRIVGWIGIGISNVFVLISHLMFVIAAHWETSTVSTRGFYTWSILTSSFILTLNIVSTVLERCICITYHKQLELIATQQVRPAAHSAIHNVLGYSYKVFLLTWNIVLRMPRDRHLLSSN